MPAANRVIYVEFHARDLELTKTFFTRSFGWAFTDYGPDYTSFGDNEFGGGFARGDRRARFAEGSAAVVIYRQDLEAARETVVRNGGTITQEIFSFPGGRRFHFTEPSGNELAVCSIDGA